MPTNLGLLPSDKPAPIQRVQIKRAVGDAGYDVTSANNGQWLNDAGGGWMGIAVTPRYPCYWLVRSNVMAHGLNSGNNWRRWDHAIMITPADADGRQYGFVCPHQLFDLSLVEWRTQSGAAMFRLNAGTTYTAYLQCQYLNPNYGITYYAGKQFTRIVGVLLGEGVV